MSEATQTLAGLMLKDTSKILKSEIAEEFSEELLSLYKSEVLEKIDAVMTGLKFGKQYKLQGRAGLSEITVSLFPAGHILGAASVLIESDGKSLLHTGDLNFKNQQLLAGASLPKRHIDFVITECTNSSGDLPDYKSEKKRLGAFINEIADKNGSILMPAFALGKTQELLKIVYSLMKKGSIPFLPIFTAGLGVKISKVYDKYCYYDAMKEPGFEVSDIPQEFIDYERLISAKYFKEPSIVIVSSGMINTGTVSHKLAMRWMKHKNFGIAFTGYQDIDSPGYSILNSPKDKVFVLNGKKIKRLCEVGKFRFTSHALIEDIIGYIGEIKPNESFIIHGSSESCEKLAENLHDLLPGKKIIIPVSGKTYEIF
jgi:Cft2 family RNA processing exonuclease